MKKGATPLGHPSPWRALLIAIATWGLLAAAMAVARLFDARARGAAPPPADAIVAALPYFVPLMLLSWGLYVAFARWPRLGERPLWVAGLMASVLIVFFPAYLVYQALVEVIQEGRPLAQLSAVIASQSRFGWWTDVMILTGTCAAHLAMAAWQRTVERDLALHRERSENLQLRLTLLQGQLEPHFLFNSLNSVSALVRTGERGAALAALTELSDLIRHALRASRSGWMSMAAEIVFIAQYLRLQRLRHGERLSIAVDVEDGRWSELACPPLLLQPLVENAVKHGVERSPAPGSISIELKLSGADMMRFSVANSLDPNFTQPAPPGTNMGLAITRDRLAALYGSRALLTTEQHADRFVATLEIPVEAIDDKPPGPDRR